MNFLSLPTGFLHYFVEFANKLFVPNTFGSKLVPLEVKRLLCLRRSGNFLFGYKPYHCCPHFNVLFEFKTFDVLLNQLLDRQTVGFIDGPVLGMQGAANDSLISSSFLAGSTSHWLPHEWSVEAAFDEELVTPSLFLCSSSRIAFSRCLGPIIFQSSEGMLRGRFEPL